MSLVASGTGCQTGESPPVRKHSQKFVHRSQKCCVVCETSLVNLFSGLRVRVAGQDACEIVSGKQLELWRWKG